MIVSVCKKIGAVYSKIEEYLLTGSLIFTVLLIFYQVIMRYVFNNSSFWSEELARYVFMWQIWLGASIGFKDDKHIKIELLTGHLKGKAKTALSLFSNILMIGFCVFLVLMGIEYLELVHTLKKVTPALRYSYVFVYASLPISAVAIGIRLLVTIFKETKTLFSPAPTIEGGEA